MPDPTITDDDVQFVIECLMRDVRCEPAIRTVQKMYAQLKKESE